MEVFIISICIICPIAQVFTLPRNVNIFGTTRKPGFVRLEEECKKYFFKKVSCFQEDSKLYWIELK